MTLGDLQGGDWLILDGLAAGDRVIVDGLQKAQPGKPVRVITGEAGEAQPAAAQPTASAAR